mmetsp:Transcript_76229/g.174630  ORF Transcript_76229/g.174630 Transcript_76229/m.174630 type:complete len:222 (+) Transcript_76229:104-769(+)
MNVLLFAPAVGLAMFVHLGAVRAMGNVMVCVAVQLALAAPFLQGHATEYFSGAFNMGRAFQHLWSVNFKFVPESIFQSSEFSRGLLGVLLVLWLAYAWKWCQPLGGIGRVLQRSLQGKVDTAEPCDIASLLYVVNFIGVICSRSLHFQFYVWYFHSLPIVLSSTCYPWWMQFVLWVVLELCWNPWDRQVGTSTPASSALLCATHLVVVVGIFCKGSRVKTE